MPGRGEKERTAIRIFMKPRFWETPGYPYRFTIDGITFQLVREEKWFRSFTSDSIESHLKHIKVSKILDQSISITEAYKALQDSNILDIEKKTIKMAIAAGGEE